MRVSSCLCLFAGVMGIAGLSGCREPSPADRAIEQPDDIRHRFSGHDTLAIAFGGLTGQVEAGGPFAGAEFHDSRPVPARISFYYPVANSIDLSTDYWKRGDSRPVSLVLHFDGRTDTLGTEPWAYEWAPYRVGFHESREAYDAAIEYGFGADLPIVVMSVTVWNRTTHAADVALYSQFAMTLRTSHTYATRMPTRADVVDHGAAVISAFDVVDTDSTVIFVANAGRMPDRADTAAGTSADFAYSTVLAPGDSLVVIQIVGSSRSGESEAVRSRATEGWEASVSAYESGIRAHVRDRGRFRVDDSELLHTARLARALLRADRHYLDGRVVPMPSPAEYNFFFTHDLLLTDFGAVNFDLDRVREDLLYVQSLVAVDSVLPHARYWKDDRYVVESANSDNWNHLWVVLLAASYLKHSGDTATVAALLPTIRKSISLMLGNERDGLMYAERPDWWDIGHVYGPRAYLTALMIRALDAYSYLLIEMGSAEAGMTRYVSTSDRMRRALVDRLWDADAGYLLNGLDSTATDRHYYTGSLLAAAFDLLDPARKDTLLDTVRRELLDPRIGVRNAMPADFHLLTETYHFQEGEVGAPFLYMNGGVWPQGNAWYAMGLIAAGRSDEALTVLKKYMSVTGVRDSPGGQPAFYEYRNADPGSAMYGSIDKPTFLWAGGWFLHVLYQLGGVRENPWNISFSADTPRGFENASYDLTLGGRLVPVTWSGKGSTFSRIVVDGVDVPSAVVIRAERRIDLERGVPAAPYLSAASCMVEAVESVDGGRGVSVGIRGIEGQTVRLEFAGVPSTITVRIDGEPLRIGVETWVDPGGVGFARAEFVLEDSSAVVTVTR